MLEGSPGHDLCCVAPLRGELPRGFAICRSSWRHVDHRRADSWSQWFNVVLVRMVCVDEADVPITSSFSFFALTVFWFPFCRIHSALEQFSLDPGCASLLITLLSASLRETMLAIRPILTCTCKVS